MNIKDSKNYKVIVGCLCALGSEILFGFSYLFSKKATNIANPFELLAWRFLFAFIIMSACSLVGIFKINLKGKNIKRLVFISLFSPIIYFIGETVGISNTSASESGVFIASVPVASMIASTIFLKKKPTKLQASGIVITLVGVIFTVVAAGVSASLSVIGYSFLSMAVVSFAIYSVLVEEATEFTGAEVTYITLTSGMVAFAIIGFAQAAIKGDVSSFITLPMNHTSFLIAILYQSVGCSILGFLMQNTAIATIGVNKSASFIGASTVASILAGVIFLKEKFTLLQVIGAIIIVGGIYIANAKNGKE